MRPIHRIPFTLPVLAVLALLVAACGEPNDTGFKPGQTDFISANPNGNDGAYAGSEGDRAGAPAADENAGGTAEPREVEEADIVRVEGNLLYVLNQYRGLQVIDITNPDQPDLIGMAGVYGYPVEMYVRGNRAYVVLSNYYSYWAVAAEDSGDSTWGGFRGSQIRVIDISNPQSPVALSAFNIQGYVTDTRIVGDVLYAVSNRYPWYYGHNTTDTVDATVVMSIDISDENDIQKVEEEQFPRNGWDNHVHVTPETIYIASSGYENNGYRTRIKVVDISDPYGQIHLRGETEVIGWVRDRWMLDEYAGVLRVVTAPDWRGTAPKVFTFQVGAAGTLTKLAELNIQLPRPESLTAVRFDGDTGYVVTYERVDPLFIIDLTDPTAPLQRGELEMPGWLDHIAPRGDRLVALGHDDSDGTWKLAVSLFDVSDKDLPIMLGRETFGQNWGWIPDERDNFDKVFKVLDNIGLVMVPFHSYGFDEDTGYWNHQGGVQLIDFTRDTLTKRGLIDHSGYVKRAIPHGDRILTVSNERMQTVNALDRDNPFVTGEVELARNVIDFVTMGGYGVQLVGDWYRGDTRLVVVPMSDFDLGAAVAEVQVTAPYGRMFVDGSFIYLVSRDWRDGKSQVHVVDLTTPSNPHVRGVVTLPEQVSYWGWYYGWSWYGGDELVQVGGDKLVFHTYRYWYRGYYAEDGRVGGGGSNADQFDRLYIVDLSDKDAPTIASTITLRDESWVYGLKSKGDLLFFSHWEPAGRDASGRYLSRYFLDRIDLTDPAHPVRLPKVNVPGFVIDLSDDLQRVYTLDYEYTSSQQWPYVRYAFNALQLQNRRASLLDRIYIDGYVGNLSIKSNAAFFTTNQYWYDADGNYQSESRLQALDLSQPWDLAIVGDVQLPDNWGWLRAVEGNRAFVDMGWMGGMLVFDVHDPADITLDSFHRHMGWVSNIHVQGQTAFLAMGYYGVNAIGLGVF